MVVTALRFRFATFCYLRGSLSLFLTFMMALFVFVLLFKMGVGVPLARPLIGIFYCTW